MTSMEGDDGFYMDLDYRRKMIHDTSTLSKEFIAFVDKFISYAFDREDSILCPCTKCLNRERKSVRDDVRLHLVRFGFDKGYDVWSFHGETRNSEPSGGDRKSKMDIMFDDIVRDFEHDPKVLASLLGEKDRVLYPGCDSEITVLSFLMNVFNMKGASSWSDVSVDALLKFLHKILPQGNLVPSSLYDAKKIICPFELEYEKIHACPNDCILYRNKYEKEVHCPICKASRWDTTKCEDREEGCELGIANEVPAKCVWYLPIIPRIERLFGNVEDAKNLAWHHDRERGIDDVIRHPSDGDQWKKIDRLYPKFGGEKRNLRLALSTDGMNPFGNMNSKHSTWPVMMVIYNLPSYLCMKRKYMLMPLLISGPRQPGNDIDVFLAPLIEDLQKLWEDGAFMYDAYRNEKFTCKAMLFCTVSDYPALGNVSGYMVKGHRACPTCEEATDFRQLKYSRKTVYLGHRRFLKKNHAYRQDKRGLFGGVETRLAPKILSGKKILEKMKKLKVVFGKKVKKSKKEEKSLWKKSSIFFELPYWVDLEVRHCLDVMHIEKNVCDSLIGTLLNIPSKTKDHYNARRDMIELRPELAPEIKGKRTYLPPGPCNLSKDEKKSVCDCLKSMKVPIGYSSNIRRCVKSDAKLSGLKSHDCHVLMQQLLPVAIRGVLDEDVRKSITRLCFFFHSICRKNIERDVLNALEIEAVEILCELELYFPPTFFDIMVHLIVHIVREIRVCGPTNFHWMYPFERHMGTLKRYKKCSNRPDASIVERYVTEEVIEYFTAQLEDGIQFGVPSNKHVGRRNGVPRSKGKLARPLFLELKRAHHYVLRNSSETVCYVEEHLSLLTEINPNNVQHEHNDTFVDWFYERCNQDGMDENLRAFARKPDCVVREYMGYDVNGFSFCTAAKDAKSTTQSSGVYVDGEQMCFLRKKDKIPTVGVYPFYGVIQSIWELDYIAFKVVVFKCKWVDFNTGVDLDDPMGFTRVNLSMEGSHEDCFILASQARQVFYVKDPLDSRWSIVLQGKKYFFEDEIDYQMTAEIAEFPSAFPEDCETSTTRKSSARRDHDDGLWVDEKGELIYEDYNKARKRKR